MAEFSDEDVQKALQMTRDKMPVTKICKVIGCSRQTYYNWKNQGRLTDGTPWDEWLNQHQQTEMARAGNEMLTVSVENKSEFWEANIPKLRKAIQRTINKLENGEMVLAPDELEQMVSLVRRVENRGKELLMMQEEFMRKVFFVLRDSDAIDKYEFQNLVEEIKQIRLEQLKEVDEDYAATLLDEVEDVELEE